MWASPPLDLLLEVFRRLDTTDLVRCACTCKPWRRAIIGNAASCLRPCPDRFVPDLLLGFFHEQLNGEAGVSLHRIPGPFERAFAVPNANVLGIDLALYDKPLSSRYGLLLLKGTEVDDLCLYNTMTGDHTFLPAAALKADTYVLVTGHDLSPSDDLGVRIIAVEAEFTFTDTDGTNVTAFRHQRFSPMSGAAVWGPVKRSPEFTKNLNTAILPGNEVVCGGTIHWLGVWNLDWLNWFDDTSTDEKQSYALALDVRTGQTWATKLPDECRHGYSWCTLVLATSGDGRLSAVMDSQFPGDGSGKCIEVWVLVSEDEWTLERRVTVPAVYVHSLFWKNNIVFCPRSGCVLFEVIGGDLVIEVDTGSSRWIRYLKTTTVRKVCGYGHGGYRYPYEMDWSTYLSRMKSF